MGGAYRFESRQALRWVDVDAAGVVNHAIWFTLIEQARFEYFARLGLLHGEVPPFLLGATSARYERPGKFGMEIVVAARTTRLGGKSFDMEYAARLNSTGETLVAITATLVWVDAQLQSSEIPAEARRVIAKFEGIAERVAKGG